MNPEDIIALIPEADPQFVSIMSSMEPPSSAVREELETALPQLHSLFLEKRAAMRAEDKATLKAVLADEVALITEADPVV